MRKSGISRPGTARPSVVSTKLGIGRRTMPKAAIRAPLKRTVCAAGSNTTRIAVTFQLGFLGQPLAATTSQAV